MSRLFYLLMGVARGGGLIYGSLMYHLLRTKEGWELVPKTSATFTDAYVDLRKFTLGDWAKHRELVAALVQAQKEELLGESAADQLQESVGRLFEGIKR